jgi:hypothetical protein
MLRTDTDLTSPAARGLAALADVGGSALATATRVASAVRPPAKPLHPRGEVVDATLRRHGGARPSGVAWLDEAGDDRVLARLSRAVGLPGPLPDVHGLGLRVPVDDPLGGVHADVLLATTGLGRLTRYTLTPTRRRDGRPYTTLLPYRGPQGALMLGAVADGEGSFTLAWAGPTGPWVAFATLDLPTTPGSDDPISFDPVLHPLPGLGQYPWLVRLREPAYRTARRSSGRTA